MQEGEKKIKKFTFYFSLNALETPIWTAQV